eukprot:GGOE01021353.1.p1 GENE.GGOE01021353.1~~GGOE01021353.1.p1  ORF type:complete len:702 (-),score=106.48 GGOE01021353.1:427-2502(-)
MKEPIPRISLENATHLCQEDDEGSIEYKWKLVNITEDRFEHLLTQMKFRVSEGQGECIYEVGVADNGTPKGLAEDEFIETIGNLRRMANRLQCDLSVLCEKVVQQSPPLKCAEVMVRKFGLDDLVDVRISMCGHAGSGKSTLVGVLTTGILDNGKGLARQKVFNHLHELESGLTSSISQQIIGFGACGNVVNYTTDQLYQVSLERIAEQSAKVCTLYDLAGHEKYLKTTVTGITSSGLDYACIAIRADKGVQQMTREHLGLCCSLDLPFFCVVTCADLSQLDSVGTLISDVKSMLKLLAVPKEAHWVQDEADALVCARNIKSGVIVPVFYTSSVNGQSLDLLRMFLNLLPVRRDWDGCAKLPVEVVLDKWFAQVADVGTVVSGLVEQGCVSCGDSLFLGPTEQGKFDVVVVDSMQVKRVNTKKVEAGTHATFCIHHAGLGNRSPGSNQFRKGMILADAKMPSTLKAYWRFEADVTILFASGKIHNNFQPVFHGRMIRQKVRLQLLDAHELLTGDSGKVQFDFLFTPEYLKEGLHFVFIDGSTKGIGTITTLIHLDPSSMPSLASKSFTRGRCHSSGASRRSLLGPRPRFFSGKSAPGASWDCPVSEEGAQTTFADKKAVQSILMKTDVSFDVSSAHEKPLSQMPPPGTTDVHIKPKTSKRAENKIVRLQDRRSQKMCNLLKDDAQFNIYAD